MSDLAAANYEERIISQLKDKRARIDRLARIDRQYVLREGAVCNWATERDDAIIEFEKRLTKLAATGSSATGKFTRMVDTF